MANTGVEIDLKRLQTAPVEYVVELATINLAGLWAPDGAMVRHPALYGYITAQCEVARVAVLRAEQAMKDAKQDVEDARADAKDRQERAKVRLEDLRTDVFLEHSRQEKPLAANRIEREVEQDARVREAKTSLLNANPDTDARVRQAQGRVRQRQAELVEAQARLAPLVAAERTFEDRRHTLDQLGARQNRELKNT